ncbi:hypothetical protein JJB09_08035 [Rhizobium sp. KVB221]|uniref:DUF945 domain-containing protein n=1 Tax=Rhizobium setariae TaxID=2801340 RepID=A0A936YPR5_9HYPH|nr:hypothetical protein [Rhizobium setariae]MBL0371974.1 hypothetical protein [Rhizobium setariae]
MRRALYSTVAILAMLAPMQTRAADVSETGARDIAEKLTHYLPKDVVDTGFLKVTAGTNRYELSVDLEALLRKIKTEDFSVTGLKPLVQYLTPQDDGLWKIETNERLDISGHFSAEGKKNNFTYLIETITFEGMFDPELSFTRTANASLQNLRFSSDDGSTKVSANIDDYSTDMRLENIDGGKADMVSNLSGKGFTETVTDPTGGTFTVSAASLDGRSQADKLGVAAFRDLVIFGLDKLKSKDDVISAQDDARLKELMKANVPFVDNLVYDINFRDITVAGQGMEASLARAGYKVEFNGIKADTRVGVEFSFNDPVIPAGVLPPGTEGALPKSASMGVAVGGMNVEGVVSYLLEHADFTKSQPLTTEQSDALSKIVLPEGVMNIEFYNVAAKSDVYDIALAGTMKVNPDESDKPEADITVTARDLDTTIKFLQDNASKVPEFGQASFMVLMIKGFGKQQPDGSMIWNVKLDRDGKVMINGQEMKI